MNKLNASTLVPTIQEQSSELSFKMQTKCKFIFLYPLSKLSNMLKKTSEDNYFSARIVDVSLSLD